MSIPAILILPSPWNLWMRGAAAPATLPDDPPVLREIIGTQARGIERLKRENDLLKHYIRELRKEHYGPRSERLPESQQIFEFYGRVEEKEKEKPASAEGQAASTPAEKKKPTGRKVIPPELERKVVVHDIPDHEKNCAECKEALAKIGEEVSERLEYQKAQLYVVQDVRPKYACAKGCNTGVMVADPPAQVIPKAKVGPGLLARIIWEKHGLHLPL